MKVAFIINPNSAKKEYENFLNQLTDKIENPNYLISQSKEDTRKFIQENRDNVDIFVAVGGDGTISSVARELINSSNILGIFPAGSGNGFANESEFSTNFNDLFSKIQKGKFREIDTFLVNNHLSINVSGAGFDGQIAKDFEQTERGFFNYIKTVILSFSNFEPININFHKKEHQKYNGKYLMVNIANTRQFGNNAYIAPHADVSDGLVDIVLVKKFPLTYAVPFAYSMFSQNLQNNEYVQYISTSEIKFSLDSDTWHIDGDYISLASPIKIKVLPKSLKILA
ncbi:MAG: YegS/Rv2252/BmrU family lipid kinase [Flavobacteriaceae bacterium]|nr:YegS/Rv2252/BmrU family lipid kinase [Flavobacteriaceae bacterium]